jgi:hypothetical protein
VRDHRLHDRLGRACLKVVEPAAEQIGVVGVELGHLQRGYEKQIERPRDNVRLQARRVLRLPCEIPHREKDLVGPLPEQK